MPQIRHLETQLEWVRSERDEERASKSREGREAAQRATEAEAQLQRLKAQRREDQKRWQKEKAALADRAKVGRRQGGARGRAGRRSGMCRGRWAAHDACGSCG